MIPGIENPFSAFGIARLRTRRPRQTTSEHYLPLWGMKPTVLDQCNLLDLHTLILTH
jgi:hypothetical protein